MNSPPASRSTTVLRIKQWLAPPVFQDDGTKTRRAALLNAALITLMTLTPVLVLGNVLGGRTPLPVFGATLGAFALFLILRSWMHRGGVRPASIGLVVMGFVLITAAVASLGTIRVPTTSMYLLLVIMAGLFFDLHGMLATSALCSFAVAGLAVAENAGILPRPDYTVTITQWVAYTAIFCWTGSLTLAALRAMWRAFSLAQVAGREREATVNFLRLLNDQNHTHELIYEVTRFLQEWTGCEAVGIRLRDGDDFPYYETRGFPAEFVQAESRLCLLDASGRPVRGTDGNPILECMCGNVLCGRYNPALPFFTEHGSFWTNSTSRLLASTSEADRQAPTRNRCNGAGYESVALIPLRHGGGTLGLLQLNDKAEGRFTPEQIAFLERTADQIAIAIAHRYAQAALLENEERFRAITSHTPDHILMQDQDLRYTLVINPQLGLTESDMIGKTDRDFLAPDDAEKLTAIKAGVLETGRPFHLETSLINREGGIEHLDGYYVPKHNTAGQVDGLIGYFHNVTEQKRAEAALRNEMAMRSVLLEHLPCIALILKNGTREIVFANEMGRQLGAIPGETCYKTCAQRDNSCSFCLAPQVWSTRSPRRLEVEDRGRYYEVRWLPLTGDLYVHYIFDITERKQMEETLRESERRYREALENANFIAVQLDKDGTILFYNKFLADLTGWELGELIGKNWFDLFIPEDSRATIQEAHTTHLTRRGAFQQYESPILTRNGGRRHISWSNSRLLDERGLVIGTTSLGVDITDRKRAEEERERLQAQLLQALKMEAVGRLAGGIAHEFNNLLFVILGSADLLQEVHPHPDPTARELLDDIRQSGRRAAELTTQLLALSRKQPRQPKLLDLNASIANLYRMLSRVLSEKVRLVTRLAANPAQIYFDPGQLEQIILNLALNARDAMPAGGTLTIETSNLAAGEHPHADASTGRGPREPSILLSIRDTGAGMSQETLAHLFEPFYTTKAPGKGGGLGLATVHGIIEQNAGSIWVQSAPGQGTTMTICLPLSSVQRLAQAAATPSPRLPGGSETILLAEDDPTVRHLAARMLRQLGYTVLEADGGLAALALAAGHKGSIHLLLTDVVMPGMHGPELARHLRDARADLRVLFMSGHVAEELGAIEDLGPQGALLSKPFTPVDLAHRLRQILDA